MSKATPGKRKRRTYSDADVAGAVLLLEAAGYPDRRGALLEVSKATNINDETLRTWYTKERRTVDPHIQERKRAEIVDALGELQEKLIRKLSEKLEDNSASLRDIAIAFGIVSDKRALLLGNATQNVQQRLVIERKGLTIDGRTAPLQIGTDTESSEGGDGGETMERGGLWPKVGEDVARD